MSIAMQGLATMATGPLAGGISQKPDTVQINRVENGFIVSGYAGGRKIAKTLEEALDLAGKELE